MAALVLRIVVGALLGACWGAPVQALALVPFLLWVWGRAATRWEAGAIAWAYYVVGTRGTAGAGGQFWGLNSFEQALLLFGTSALLATPWALLWSESLQESRKVRYQRVAALLALGLVPGWAAISVVHPLTATGVLFPGLGWIGLALCAVLLCEMPYGRLPVAAWAVSAIFGLSRADTDHGFRPDIRGVQTSLATPRNTGDWRAQGDVAVQAMAHVRSANPLTVFPEGLGGVWTPAMAKLWLWPRAAVALRGHDVLVGALVPEGKGYDAALVSLVHGPVYLQRYPVPGAMWRPWSPKGATHAHWMGQGTVRLRYAETSVHAGMLVCFEQLLLAPVLQSVAEGAEVLIASSNHRWTRDTQIPAVQRAAVAAWARLFSLPVVRADNS